MKCLRVNNGTGEFSTNGSDFKGLDSINKEDIFSLLSIALSNEDDFEMDEYNPESIKNPAHKIIYENLHKKFAELQKNKEQFLAEVSGLYKEAYVQYQEERDIIVSEKKLADEAVLPTAAQ